MYQSVLPHHFFKKKDVKMILYSSEITYDCCQHGKEQDVVALPKLHLRNNYYCGSVAHKNLRASSCGNYCTT